jgi:hypothetical protein
MQSRGLHGGHHLRISCSGRGCFRPTISPSDPAMAPIVTYEYLCCLPSSERLRPPARRKARGLLSGSYTPGTVCHRLQPKILDMTGSLEQQMTGESYTPYWMWPHHSWLKGRSHKPKRTEPRSNPHLCFSLL